MEDTMSEKITAAEYRAAAKVATHEGDLDFADHCEFRARKAESAEKAWEKYAEAVDAWMGMDDASYKSVNRWLKDAVNAADPRRNSPAGPTREWLKAMAEEGPVSARAPVKDEPTREEIESALALYNGSCDAVLRATLRRVWADKLQEGV